MARRQNAIVAEMYEFEARDRQARAGSRARGVQSAWLANDLPERTEAARKLKPGQEVTLMDGTKASVVSHDPLRALLKVRVGQRSFTCNPKSVKP